MTRLVCSLAILLMSATWLPAQTFGLGGECQTEVLCDDTFGLNNLEIPDSCPECVIELPPRVNVEVAAPKPNPAPAKPSPYTSPRGMHWHKLPNGDVFEHEDWNYGDPVAHQGMKGDWDIYTGPKAPNVLPPNAGSVAAPQSNCPGGVCPTPTRRGGLFRRFR